MPDLEHAIALAVEAHRGQRDKAGQPYVLHVLRVVLAVDGELEQMAAALHDVVEDTPITFAQLRERGYPEAVVSAVEHLTRQDGESYQAFVDRAATHPIARKVKLADIEDNLDLRRIAEPTERDLARLRRYRQAWERLRQTS